MPTYASRSLWTTPPFAFDAATLAWIANVFAADQTTVVSNAQATLVNNLIVGGQNDGWFYKLDRLWLFAVEAETEATVDLVQGQFQSAVNLPTFTANSGYAFDGATQYIDSLFTPSTAGGNYIQDSASASVWVVSQGSGATDYIGSFASIPGTGIEVRANGVSNINGAPAPLLFTPQDGLLTIARTGANQNDIYGNGVNIGTGAASPSVANTSKSIFFAARNFDGIGPDLHAACQLACGLLGGGLDATDASNLYARLRTYMTAVGVP